MFKVGRGSAYHEDPSEEAMNRRHMVTGNYQRITYPTYLTTPLPTWRKRPRRVSKQDYLNVCIHKMFTGEFLSYSIIPKIETMTQDDFDRAVNPKWWRTRWLTDPRTTLFGGFAKNKYPRQKNLFLKRLKYKLWQKTQVI